MPSGTVKFVLSDSLYLPYGDGFVAKIKVLIMATCLFRGTDGISVVKTGGWLRDIALK